MSTQNYTTILSFLREQIARVPQRVRMYTFNSGIGKPYPHRNVFKRLREYAKDFLDGNTQNRLLILSGLRGAGKTTLFAQVFSDLSSVPNTHKLFISLDETRVLGLSLSEVISVYEKEILGTSFENLDTPVFIFLDEVQYDKNWALVVKTIHNRTDRVCIFATGSSSLDLHGDHIGADIARRAQYERIFPMSFTEYIKIKYNKYEVTDIDKNICAAFTDSDNAVEFYEKMHRISSHAASHISNVDPLETMAYLKHGSLPFVLLEKNELRIYERIMQVIQKVVRDDIPAIEDFDIGTVTQIPHLLYTISNSDTVVVSNVSDTVDMTRPVITKVLESLEKTETLLRIYPYGSADSKVRKPSKYTFMSSSVRATLFHIFGTILTEEDYKGKLLEDAVALSLYRTFVGKGWSLTYDSSRGGADFIIHKGNKAVVIEAGFGDKDTRQVRKTMHSINKDCFGVVISDRPLSINKEESIVHIPIDWFLLM